jgi:hypothetical protein
MVRLGRQRTSATRTQDAVPLPRRRSGEVGACRNADGGVTSCGSDMADRDVSDGVRRHGHEASLRTPSNASRTPARRLARSPGPHRLARVAPAPPDGQPLGAAQRHHANGSASVERTLARPMVAERRDQLVPELAVAASTVADDGETIVSGRAPPTPSRRTLRASRRSLSTGRPALPRTRSGGSRTGGSCGTTSARWGQGAHDDRQMTLKRGTGPPGPAAAPTRMPVLNM